MNTLKVNDAEFAVSATIDTFVTIFNNPGKPTSMSISLSGSGAPFASTQRLPEMTEEDMDRWFDEAKDENGNVIPNRFQSKFQLLVSYNGLKRGSKNPNQLFVNIGSIGERPRASQATLNRFFAKFKAPAAQTAEQANAAITANPETNDAENPF